MSRTASINVAVRHQLVDDGKNLTYSDAIDRAGHGYAGPDQIKCFLLGVSNRLRLDKPRQEFNWASVDAGSLADMLVLMLISFLKQQTPDGVT
ncbi:hypothetical protein [Bradyrhizobium sp. STM 3557]|uniref:hypothetical protein n=1 Tax=Bradyrhizobium sp. STM 3557 TaxID=578920 RepID=UPI00388D9351